MKPFSRRSALQSIALVPLVASPARAQKGPTDTALVTLGRQFDAVAARIDIALEAGPDLDWSAFEEFHRIKAEVLAKSATTLDGLFVKAKLACWALLGDLEPSDQSGSSELIALSIIQDLIRLYQPSLERPGALKTLVKEIGDDAVFSLRKPHVNEC